VPALSAADRPAHASLMLHSACRLSPPAALSLAAAEHTDPYATDRALLLPIVAAALAQAGCNATALFILRGGVVVRVAAQGAGQGMVGGNPDRAGCGATCRLVFGMVRGPRCKRSRSAASTTISVDRVWRCRLCIEQ
jgi:hypothetical protein